MMALETSGIFMQALNVTILNCNVSSLRQKILNWIESPFLGKSCFRWSPFRCCLPTLQSWATAFKTSPRAHRERERDRARERGPEKERGPERERGPEKERGPEREKGRERERERRATNSTKNNNPNRIKATLMFASVTRKKSPNVYKSCTKWCH